MATPPPSPTVLSSRRRASALVIALAFIVLVTFLVVAFLTKSQSDFMASSNHARGVQVEGIAQFGESMLISQLQQEVKEGMRVTGPAATVWPARSIVDDPNNGGDASSEVTKETDPRAFPAFRMSSTRSPDFSGAYGAGVSLPVNPASNVRTDAGTRPFDNPRWNVPKLLPYTPVKGSEWPNCPTWIYVTRSGPRSPQGSGAAAATVAEMKNAAGTNDKFALGRFSYIMYDISGLLDANVAALSDGNFTTASSSPAFGEKGTTAFANLDPLISSVTEGGNASDFMSWRQNTSVDFYHSIAGDETTLGLLEKGMLESPKNSNLFFSRQDLIKFSRDNPTILRGGRSHLIASGKDSDAGVLKYLRTWSRNSNGPTIPDAMPKSNVTDWRMVQGGLLHIPRHRLADCKREDYIISVGEPFLARKFPLSRIRWFSMNCAANGEPSSTADYNAKAAIKQHFGLTWVENIGTLSPGSLEWSGVPGFVYTSPDSDSAVNTIKTLEQVAATKREPDFFEWLKAAINTDTLGIDAGMTDSTVALMQDQVRDFQIIQIGANIIDQADPNDLPTLISTRTAFGSSGDRNGNPLVAIGVENLPYINEIIIALQRQGKYGTAAASTIQAWIQPEIWMPHYIPTDERKKPRKDYGNNSTVQNFRMRVMDGEAWLDARVRLSANGELTAVTNASRIFRQIDPRVFTGDPTNDAVTFSILDDDFADPKIPGQTAVPNAYNNGPWNQGPESLRKVYAGPEPGTPFFKGIFGGQVRNAGLAPGPSYSTDYAQRRYPRSSLHQAASCLLDPRSGTPDPSATGYYVPNTAQVTFPMGDHYYNVAVYNCNPYSVPLNPPAGSSVPRPLTIVLEAQLPNGAWVPTQVMENIAAIEGNDNLYDFTSAATGELNMDGNSMHSGATGTQISNINPVGAMIVGYTPQVGATVDAQTRYGAMLCYDPAMSGPTGISGGTSAGGGQVPEFLGWCRPVLTSLGQDPDPANNIYPLSKNPGYSGTRAGIPRNNETIDTNEKLANNNEQGLSSGKTLAGTVNNNNPLFGSYWFGWSSMGSRFSVLKIDPRTRRFGQSGTSMGSSGGSSVRPSPALYNGPAALPNNLRANWDFVELCAPGNNWWNTKLPGEGSLLPNWWCKFVGSRPNIGIADLMRNGSDTSQVNVNYKDRDGVIRPADYAYTANTQLPSLDSTIYPEALTSRPVVLNRMFRSPAELGLVFRDIPWRSLDFFSEGTGSGSSRAATSGDIALLNIFGVADGPYSAGAIDPNKAPLPVLQALLANTLEYPAKEDQITALTSTSETSDVISHLFTNISYDPSNPAFSKSIMNESDILTTFMTDSGIKPSLGTRKNKTAVESFIRGLSGSVDTRTWNVMIDLLAESGRLPVQASDLSQFIPSSQKRYWIFLAIDRVTGQILDKNVESINE